MQTDKPGSLKEAFGGFGAAPSDQLWNSIESNLDKNENKKRAIIWWWFGGIAAAILILFGTYELGYNSGRNSSAGTIEKTIDSQYTNQQKVDGTVQVNSENNNVADNGNALESANEESSDETALLNNEETDQKKVEQKKYNFKTPDLGWKFPTEEIVIVDPQNPKGFLQNDVTMIQKLPGVKISGIENAPDNVLTETLQPLEKGNKPGVWQIGFEIGNLYTTATTQALMIDGTSISAFDNLDTENTIQGTGTSNYNAITELEASVRRPVFAEFEIARSFGSRWQLQTGLGINLIRSVNRYYNASMESVRSNFVSVSIPLVVSYEIVKRNRFSFSAGVGLNYEMPFYQMSKTNYATSLEASTKSNSFCSGYMISALLKPQFTFHLNEKLSIGLNPLTRYYIHQSLQADVPVLKRNLWMGLSAGVIWRL